MTAELEVRGLLAERYAAVVDRASARGDEVGMLRAAEKLLEILDRLPVRMSPAEGGENDGDGDDGRGRILTLMDSGPTLGDTANP